MFCYRLFLPLVHFLTGDVFSLLCNVSCLNILNMWIIRSWNGIFFFEKLLVSLLVRQFFSQYSLNSLQEPVTLPCPESYEPKQHFCPFYFTIPFNLILPSTLRSSNQTLSFSLFNPKSYVNIFSLFPWFPHALPIAASLNELHWRYLRIVKLPIVQFSSASCYSAFLDPDCFSVQCTYQHLYDITFAINVSKPSTWIS